MEHLGLFGMLITWLSYITAMLLSKVLKVIGYFDATARIQLLQEISLVCAITVSIFTVLWYIGNMLIKRKELWKSFKDMFRRKK